ncbi:MAG TPA: alpha/beta fold hydrolase [Candidatus Acidoferrales bacterium]|nr:alpha/beta fold hydrolase [Candidatus Acidoferrales bacterium]
MANRVVTGFAPSAGTGLYFETVGDGDALVFVHAGVSDRRMWDAQFEFFASRHRVIRYDLRGFGKSKMGEGPYSLREDLRSVLAFLGVEKAALVGCSMGGAAAIDFALTWPAMVSALVPVAAGISGFEWSADSISHWTRMMKLVQERDVEQAREIDARYWIDGPSRDAARVDTAYRERARKIHGENFDLQRFARPEQELKPPALQRLGDISCPTLVVVGDSDTPDLIKLAKRLAAEIRGAKIAMIENAAHLPSMEHPGKFNELLQQFLSSISTRS